jgi:hypothetical protein
MEAAKITGFKHATLAARPVGVRGDPATRISTMGSLPIAGATAAGGAGAKSRPSAITGEKDGKPRGRPTKDDRRRERRMEVMAEIDDLLDNKPTKNKIRIYLLARIQQLLEEKGITVSHT